MSIGRLRVREPRNTHQLLPHQPHYSSLGCLVPQFGTVLLQFGPLIAHFGCAVSLRPALEHPTIPAIPCHVDQHHPHNPGTSPAGWLQRLPNWFPWQPIFNCLIGLHGNKTSPSPSRVVGCCSGVPTAAPRTLRTSPQVPQQLPQHLCLASKPVQPVQLTTPALPGYLRGTKLLRAPGMVPKLNERQQQFFFLLPPHPHA